MLLTVTPNPCLHKIISFRGVLEGRTVVRPVQSTYQGGGKGINAARAARTFGATVRALTTAGGAIGRLFLEGLAAEGLDVEAVEVASATRMSTFVYGADTGQFREFLEPGQPVDAGEVERLKQHFSAALAGAALVTLNGSVSDPQLYDFHAWAVGEARRAGVRAIVDTYGPPVVAAARARPYMLKANLDEVETSFGVGIAGAADVASFARSLLKDGVENVLLTHGESGAWLFQQGVGWRIQAPQVEELNAVGSGDAMLGVLAARLEQGAGLLDAVRLGAAAGAANAARLGVCDFARRDVEALLGQVSAERLA